MKCENFRFEVAGRDDDVSFILVEIALKIRTLLKEFKCPGGK